MTARAEPEHTSRGNLSAWAVAHPAFVLFFIIVFSAVGLMSYLSLGRAEDPSFTIKTMVISAAWPGATAEEMQDQVADKLEKRLQELRSEEHTSELQSLTNLVCRLLLEKK